MENCGGRLPERIVVVFKEGKSDPAGRTAERTARDLGISLESVETRKVYTLTGDVTQQELKRLQRDLFVDRIAQRAIDRRHDPAERQADWIIEVSYRPGVKDNEGETSVITMPSFFKRRRRKVEVFTSTQYLLKGATAEDAKKLALGLANPIIQDIKIIAPEELTRLNRHGYPENRIIKGAENRRVDAIPLNVGDDALMRISKERTLSLSLPEMKNIAAHFEGEGIGGQRRAIGMDAAFLDKPTDVELEALAQTWSEHCKHKIFNALIEYYGPDGKREVVDSLFKTFIERPSTELGKKLGWVVSAFRDNAGIVRFNSRLHVADKVETHNAPSAKDPYGGAITGILGVNRDILGAGMGAEPVLNVYGYCFGSPRHSGVLPDGVLHPKRIRDGVHHGVMAGGNESGIPLAYSMEFFDERFAARPLVFCGTIGIMPPTVNGKPSEVKKADAGDLIVMVGGRVGKDGIHGATFSSAELDSSSPVQAVQIGDSYTQKKVSDFLIEARDLGLFKSVTDNGAGGLSSSVGEMAKDSGGCRMDLRKVPLKYQGLAPWEILVSESQERMTFAVDPKKRKAFLDLAKRRDVEATVLGNFENGGKFHITYDKTTVAYLDMDFLHNGLPRMNLTAKLHEEEREEPVFNKPQDMGKTLESMLARLNVCSKEEKIRQYDHEVKGLSVIKPLVGKDADTPSDATVSLVEYGSREGIIVAEAANPHYSDIDTYRMAASVIDEGIRRAIAVGGKLPGADSIMYALDNFCWNFSALDTDDGEHKLAQLVQANRALRDFCIAFGIPCISGKDSMKNTWRTKDGKLISIPPTLMFSVRAKMDDVDKAVTMDAKAPGDLVYVVGKTYDEMGASEYYSHIGEELSGKRYIGNGVPEVRAVDAKRIYEAMGRATGQGIVASIHTPTIGGLGVALARSAFAGGFGMDIDLSKVPYSGERRDDFVLYSQSNSRFVVTVPPEKKEEFERLMQGNAFAEIGMVTADSGFRIKGLNGETIVDKQNRCLKGKWQGTLAETLSAELARA